MANPARHRRFVQSYLSTAASWDRDTLDILSPLFTAEPWLPPAATLCRTATCIVWTVQGAVPVVQISGYGRRG
jgi:hypothetical protein